MKHLVFKGTTDCLEGLLADPALKPYIHTKLSWNEHVLIAVDDDLSEETISYITLKYGDYRVHEPVKDFSPIPGKDYIPVRTK